MSALGHKRTYAVQKGMSALPPIATAKADMEMVMSALPPRADMCGATSDVRSGPKADIPLWHPRELRQPHEGKDEDQRDRNACQGLLDSQNSKRSFEDDALRVASSI